MAGTRLAPSAPNEKRFNPNPPGGVRYPSRAPPAERDYGSGIWVHGFGCLERERA